MKKSEMVTIIKNVLDMSNLTDKDLTWVAEHILSEIESIGMLPPEIKTKIAIFDSGCEEEGYDELSINMWEEE